MKGSRPPWRQRRGWIRLDQPQLLLVQQEKQGLPSSVNQARSRLHQARRWAILRTCSMELRCYTLHLVFLAISIFPDLRPTALI